MDAERILPEFTSEAEAAQWWFENEAALDAQFAEAAARHSLGHGALARSKGLAVRTVQLDLEDVVLAGKQAEQKGVEYQSYVRQLLHEALLQQEKVA